MQNRDYRRKSPFKLIGILTHICVAATILISAPSFADTNLSQISYSKDSARIGVGIRLTIIPATISPVARTPFTAIEAALESNELYRLELDASLAADFLPESNSVTKESDSELLRRIEQNLDSSSATAPVVITLAAG